MSTNDVKINPILIYMVTINKIGGGSTSLCSSTPAACMAYVAKKWKKRKDA